MAKQKTDKKEKSKPENNNKSVQAIFNSYRDNLFAINVYYQKFEALAIAQDTKGLKKDVEFIKTALLDIGIDIENPNKKRKITENQAIQLGNKMLKKPKISIQHHEILSESTFLMLNNYFEYLISDLLSYYYEKFSDIIKTRDLKISLSELEEFSTIKDLRESLVIKEVEKMLVELTFNDLLNHFEKNLKISLNKEIIEWDRILEARERRHLIVHNSSRVNKKYISRTGNPYKYKINDKVIIDKEYFELIFKIYRLAGFLLTFNCWGSWDKTNASKAIRELSDESFKELEKENYSSTIVLADFSDNIEAREPKEAGYLLKLKFNRCIALKKLKKEEELKKQLAKIDVSTSEPLYKLAHAILSIGNPALIIDLVNQCKKLDDINIEYYLEWPLYRLLKSRRKLNNQIIEILK